MNTQPIEGTGTLKALIRFYPRFNRGPEWRMFEAREKVREYLNNHPEIHAIKWSADWEALSETRPELVRDEKNGHIEYYSWSNCE